MERKGHGRRCKPKDLPRRREEIDLSEAEKVCTCCGTVKFRIGQSTSERLDYQPMAIFVRELVRPTYACRLCESHGHDPQIAKPVLPPESIPKSGIGSGLLAHTLFDLTAGRSHTFPQRFLRVYRGFVHSDAYDGYNAVHRNLRHLGCWMHARRYFVEAEPSDPRAVEALAFIRTFYTVEREIKDERDKPCGTFTDGDVVRIRRTRAGPILAQLSDWLEEQHRRATPKSLF